LNTSGNGELAVRYTCMAALHKKQHKSHTKLASRNRNLTVQYHYLYLN